MQTAPAERLPVSDPAWMAPILESLAREDLAPATLRGYRYDLRHFLAWHATVQPDAFALDRLAEFELIAYRHDQPAPGCLAPPVPMGPRHWHAERRCRPRPPAGAHGAQPSADRPGASRGPRAVARRRGFDPRPRRA